MAVTVVSAVALEATVTLAMAVALTLSAAVEVVGEVAYSVSYASCPF